MDDKILKTANIVDLIEENGLRSVQQISTNWPTPIIERMVAVLPGRMVHEGRLFPSGKTKTIITNTLTGIGEIQSRRVRHMSKHAA